MSNAMINLLDGAASVFVPVRHQLSLRQRTVLSRKLPDGAVIASDWIVVGKDVRKAIATVRDTLPADARLRVNKQAATDNGHRVGKEAEQLALFDSIEP